MRKSIFGAVIISIILTLPANAQKVIQDKIDPFTNERTVVTNNVTLTSVMGKAVLQAGGSAKITDSAVIYFLSFLHETFVVNSQSSDSVKKECLLKTVNDRTITGNWVSDGTAQIGWKYYAVYTYRFTQIDFENLLTSGITDVKINTRLFQIDRKNQNKLTALCKSINSKIRK
jgi:hypothetical protein